MNHTNTTGLKRVGTGIILVVFILSTLSLLAASPAAAEVSATDQEVVTDGSTIELTIDGVSGGIDPLPTGWVASSPSDGGNVFATGGVNWAFSSSAERTVDVTITPPDNASVGDSITLTAYDGSDNEQNFVVNVTESQIQTIYVDNQTVFKQGSTIEITFNNTVSGGVEDIPNNWNVTDVSEPGDELATSEVNWNFGEIVTNQTVTFDIAPAANATVNETVTLTAYDDTNDSVEFSVIVDESQTHESGVSERKYNTIANLGGQNSVTGRSLSAFRRDLVTGDYLSDPAYEDIDVSGRDYAQIRRYLIAD